MYWTKTYVLLIRLVATEVRSGALTSGHHSRGQSIHKPWESVLWQLILPHPSPPRPVHNPIGLQARSQVIPWTRVRFHHPHPSTWGPLFSGGPRPCANYTRYGLSSPKERKVGRTVSGLIRWALPQYNITLQGSAWQ